LESEKNMYNVRSSSKGSAKGRDGLLGSLNLEPSVQTKLKGLQDVLKPYLVEGAVDVSGFCYFYVHLNDALTVVFLATERIC
jgi:hypothetical protein